MIEELIKSCNDNMSIQDVKQELEEAMEMTDTYFKIIADPSRKTIRFKIGVKNQNLKRHTEQYVDIKFGWPSKLSYNTIVDMGLCKLWAAHNSNFYQYMGEIMVSYRTVLDNLNNDSNNDFENGF